MASEYQVPDVSGEIIADAAKTLANSPSPMTMMQLTNCYVGQFSSEYVRRAAIACVQLGLAEQSAGHFTCVETHRDVLKKARKDEMRVAFGYGLQNYGPFLLYADYLSKGFSTVDAATRTKGLFQIQTSPDKIEKNLKGWGKYAGLFEDSPSGLKIKVHTDHLLVDYVKKLVEALEAELQSKLFTIDMLGPEVFTYLDSSGIKLDDVAKALRNYETDPKTSAGRSLEIFEKFVHTLAGQKGVNNQKPTGLMNWVDGFQRQDLPSNLLHVCHGMVGMRNMTHHNPDVETGHEWNISKQAALTSTLLVPIVIRAVYLYASARKQEF